MKSVPLFLAPLQTHLDEGRKLPRPACARELRLVRRQSETEIPVFEREDSDLSAADRTSNPRGVRGNRQPRHDRSGDPVDVDQDPVLLTATILPSRSPPSVTSTASLLDGFSTVPSGTDSTRGY